MFPTSLQPRRAAGTELVGHGFLTLCMTAARFAVLVLVTSHAREEIPAPCGAQDQSSSWIPKQSQELCILIIPLTVTGFRVESKDQPPNHFCFC